MKTLKAGDIRKDGDEQSEKDYEYKKNERPPQRAWVQADHIGWPILASDLMHLEFRRPV